MIKCPYCKHKLRRPEDIVAGFHTSSYEEQLLKNNKKVEPEPKMSSSRRVVKRKGFLY